MARTNYVAKARGRKPGKAAFTCYTCHEDIVEGDAYAWNQPSRYSMRYNWHTRCAPPRPSALEANEKRSAAMAAFEDGYDALDQMRNAEYGEDFDPEAFVEEIKDNVFTTVADAVREAGELWRESATNIEEGFGHPTSMSEEYEGYADEVESVADDVESIDLDEYDEEQWDDVDQWREATLDSAAEELGSFEGNLP